MSDHNQPENEGISLSEESSSVYAVVSSSELRHLISAGLLLPPGIEEVSNPARGWQLELVLREEIPGRLSQLKPHAGFVPVVLEVELDGSAGLSVLPVETVRRAFFPTEEELSKFENIFSLTQEAFFGLIPLESSEELFAVGAVDQDVEEGGGDGAVESGDGDSGSDAEAAGKDDASQGEQDVEGIREAEDELEPEAVGEEEPGAWSLARRIDVAGGAVAAARRACGTDGRRLRRLESLYPVLAEPREPGGDGLAPLRSFLSFLVHPEAAGKLPADGYGEAVHLARAMAEVALEFSGQDPGARQLISALGDRLEDLHEVDKETRNHFHKFVNYLEELARGKKTFKLRKLADLGGEEDPEKSSVFQRGIILLILDPDLMHLDRMVQEPEENSPGEEVLFTAFVLSGALRGLSEMPKEEAFSLEREFMKDLSLRLGGMAAAGAKDRKLQDVLLREAGTVERKCELPEERITWSLSAGRRNDRVLIEWDAEVKRVVWILYYMLRELSDGKSGWSVSFTEDGEQVLVEIPGPRSSRIGIKAGVLSRENEETVVGFIGPEGSEDIELKNLSLEQLESIFQKLASGRKPDSGTNQMKFFDL